ncbi:DUF998 domain-containing protein [Amycolatopsis sp.]|uniref:DUF998 domain-containing protein n=1 Tax=Amycolatopsis sp. TaxID=37632 RepID=UPI002BD69D89|nr:DUF998 domain-containing protein [Amycolatopsis sp.]HVV12577.1 DUF998 domain-containing protein [Amycolatopsis sp.]
MLSPPTIVATSVPEAVRDPLPSRLVRTAAGCLGTAAVLLVLLHLVRGLGGAGNPVTDMLSDYGLARGWWLWDLTLVLVSAGSAAISAALRRIGALSVPALSFLVLWCLSLCAVAVFTKDPQGGAVTFTGKLHLYATGVGCAALPLAGLALAARHRAHPRWSRFARWSRALSLASVPFFLPFIVPFAAHILFGMTHFPTIATGLVERAMAVFELCQLTLLAWWARSPLPGQFFVDAHSG